MTQPPTAPTLPPDPKRRLARKVMPFIAADSALLPPDSWIIATLKDAYKTVQPFRRDVQALGALVVGAAAVAVTLAAGLVTLAVIGTVTLAAAAGSAAVTLAGGLAAFWRGRQIWQRAQKDTLPAMKEDIGRRYVAYKAEEMMREWRLRLETQRAAKQKAAPAEVSATPAPAPIKTSLRDVFRRKPVATTPVSPPPAKPPQP